MFVVDIQEFVDFATGQALSAVELKQRRIIKPRLDGIVYRLPYHRCLQEVEVDVEPRRNGAGVFGFVLKKSGKKRALAASLADADDISLLYAVGVDGRPFAVHRDVAVRDGLACGAARGQKARAVGGAVRAHFEGTVKARGRVGLRVGGFRVVGELALRDAVGEAYALLLKKLTPVIAAAAAAARIPFVGGRAGLRERELLGLRLLENCRTEALRDLKF